jgi:hypothetical protein
MRNATFAIFLACSALAAAQPRMTTQLALARICASEAGLQITDDCAAILLVLERGAASRGIDILDYARAYVPHAFDGSDGRRPWISELEPSGAQPAHWPTQRFVRNGDHVEVRRAMPWSRYRQRWLDLYAYAGEVVARRVSSRCARPPDHWGCPMDRGRQCLDHERAIRAGLLPVDCGDSRNEFWTLPGR